MNAPRRDLVLVPAALLADLLSNIMGASGHRSPFADILNYQPPPLPGASRFGNVPVEPVDRMLCARMLASRAARLLRLLELGAPEPIIEDERRLVMRALAKLPINVDAARYSDALDAENDNAAPGRSV